MTSVMRSGRGWSRPPFQHGRHRIRFPAARTRAAHGRQGAAALRFTCICASGEVPVATGPQDPAAAGRDRLRAGHVDREQVIDTLKTAFVHGRLTRDELDARAGQALAGRTYADLAALTADIPAEPAAAGPACPPAPARRRPLARAAAGSGGCLVIAVAAVWAGFILDPGPPHPTPYHSWARLCLVVAVVAVLMAMGILGIGVVTAVDQRSSRRQLPPRPGPGTHALEGGRRGDTGHGPVPPEPRPGQTRADLRAHKSRQHRRARFRPSPAGAALLVLRFKCLRLPCPRSPSPARTRRITPHSVAVPAGA